MLSGSCPGPGEACVVGGSCISKESPDRALPPLSADERVSSTLKQQIIQARTAKKMTQAQLAQVGGGSRGRYQRSLALSAEHTTCKEWISNYRSTVRGVQMQGRGLGRGRWRCRETEVYVVPGGSKPYRGRAFTIG